MIKSRFYSIMEEHEDVTFVAEKEIILEMAEELGFDIEEDEFKDSVDILALSKIEMEDDLVDIIIEEVFDKDGKMIPIDAPVFVYQEYVLDEEDLESVDSHLEIKVRDMEEKCEEEPLKEEVEDFLDGAIEMIENGECLNCVLRKIYKVAYKDGVNSLALSINEELDRVVESDLTEI